ncbi:MAG: hypothetical protein PF444_01750 [Bacteroidales bacterium]|jgi:hypothetical protein|nr:hypothetical protein [Bacteroidales bacterium]
MKTCLFIVICLLLTARVSAQKTSSVYVDKTGTMRWSDSQDEASFFGVNYTLPFAHAYRAVGYLGKDRKKAIDDDVYHFSRLGFNAYRIHLWDVEISDSTGHLLNNEHLDLLDYLIAKLKERHIHVVITPQTNFGNGYPEKNQQTEGFSSHYDKCSVHSDSLAIAAQERYLAALVQHVNPYTGRAYKDDPIIVGFEVNNEPCHSGSIAQTHAYITRMLAALKKAGNTKPVFYNVSHNRQVVEAYYDSDIQGTTYQWYPTGLVSGHTRKGNFLAHVDEYPIPFSEIKGFKNKAKLVYEFDPADVLYSYMYPAIVRTFRTAGFQWITQFAYDPMAIASYNTEYQTHFLNLAYTPKKAISMKIAAEAAIQIPLNKSYGVYPQDTLFDNFRVSYKHDLSEYNTASKFFYSNTTNTLPRDARQLESIAGCGSSPLVHYKGLGAYFMDKLEDGLWRLELMPDAIPVSDPFEKPSLDKEVVRIYYGQWDMTLNLPDLGPSFSIRGINSHNVYHKKTDNNTIDSLSPGVYLLQKKDVILTQKWDSETPWKNIQINEFVAPKGNKERTLFTVYHQPSEIVESGKELTIKAIIAGVKKPDSILIYTDKISFWNAHNPSYKMKNNKGYNYETVIPAEEVNKSSFKYNIVVYRGGEAHTFPGNSSNTPLAWDYTSTQLFESKVVSEEQPIVLFSVSDSWSDMEVNILPEWCPTKRQLIENTFIEKNTMKLAFSPNNSSSKFYIRKYIKDELIFRLNKLKMGQYLCLHIKKIPKDLKVGFVTADAYTYTASCPPPTDDIIRIPLSDLQQTRTALLPKAYPVFMNSFFTPSTDIPFAIESIETLELSFEGQSPKVYEIELGDIWIE